MKIIKNLKEKINSKILAISVMATTPLLAGGVKDNLLTAVNDNQASPIKLIQNFFVNNKFISMVTQAIIILAIIYALVNIAKEFLGGQGGGNGVWKNVGAILFLGLTYYLLFIKIAGSSS